jgi:phage tail-like protein
MIITLLNQSGEVVVTWNVTNAFPIKVQSTDLKGDGNEIAIETMEIVHEGLTIQNK